MKLSRISLPFNSPTRIAAKAGRVFLDVVAGVLTLRSTLGSINIGAEAIINDTAVSTTITQAWHNAYVRKSFATACTIIIPEENGTSVAFIPGSSFIVKNVGAGALTLTPENTAGDLVVINGDKILAAGDSMKVIRIAQNLWETISFHDVAQG